MARDHARIIPGTDIPIEQEFCWSGSEIQPYPVPTSWLGLLLPTVPVREWDRRPPNRELVLGRGQVAVYMLYDETSDTLPCYVGVTDNLPRRWKQHARTKRWWPEVKGFEVRAFPDRASALAHEAALIEASEPTHNRTGPAYHHRRLACVGIGA